MIDLSYFKNRLLPISVSALALCSSAFGGEKLRVYILAGQSNTVGWANAHTIPTLYQTGNKRDAALAKMVFGESQENEIAAQLVRARELDKISGGINFPTMKAMEEGPKKTALNTKIEGLFQKHEAYKAKVLSSCAQSDRVYISSIADRNVRSGKLGPGYGAKDGRIGPEYGFGLSIAEKVDGPILLIKSSWGGKSLMYDFRPPSAEEFSKTVAYENAQKSYREALEKFEEAKKSFPERQQAYEEDLAKYEEAMKTADEATKKKLRAPRKVSPPREPRAPSFDMAGHFWNEMVKHTTEVLKDPGNVHPDYDPKEGYEIAGFVWFQGYNDQFNPEYHGNYTDNMKVFIKDVRATFKTPKMPFVIGVLGTPRIKEEVDKNEVSKAQRAAATAPEFKGNVAAVESYLDYSNFSHEVFSKGWPKHYHEWDTVGSDRPYHYLGSGAFFIRLGDSFAKAIHQLK
ncbi:MAG: sialate O-acetylesterase [Akkermansiaceae bacterium]